MALACAGRYESDRHLAGLIALVVVRGARALWRRPRRRRVGSAAPRPAARARSSKPPERRVFLLGLRRRGTPGQFANRVSDPSSGLYRRFLSLREYRKRFSPPGPSADAYGATSPPGVACEEGGAELGQVAGPGGTDPGGRAADLLRRGRRGADPSASARHRPCAERFAGSQPGRSTRSAATRLLARPSSERRRPAPLRGATARSRRAPSLQTSCPPPTEWISCAPAASMAPEFASQR